jgi:PAS domain S-box-containing protein
LNQALKELLDAASRAAGAEVLLATPAQAAGPLPVLATSSGLRGISTYRFADGDVWVPVTYRDEELAHIVAPNPGVPVSRDILAGFASAAGFMLGHAQELQEALDAHRESYLLRELGALLVRPGPIEELLTLMLRTVRHLFNADYATIATVEANGTTRWRASDGHITEKYKEVTFQPGRGTAARVIAAGKPITLEGIGSSPDLPADEFPVHIAEGGVSVLAVPLFREGKAIGTVMLGSRTPRKWKESETTTLSVVANAAGLAIDQKRASSSESSQRAFLSKIIESFPGALIVMEPPDWRVLLINSNFASFLPEPLRNDTSVQGRTAREITPNWTEQNDATIAMFQKVVDTGEVISFEQIATEDPQRGTTYWNWSVVPVDGVGEDGKRVAMLIGHEVTETVLAREKANLSAERARARAEELEAIINQMADGVAIFDGEGRVLRMNPAGERLMGRSVVRGEEPGEYPRLYGLYSLEGDLLTQEKLTFTRALHGETVIGEQIMVRRARDNEVILSVSGSPLTGSDGTISGAVLVFHDITQEKMTERLKDEFLSVVSHELRTPLSAIMGYSDLMLRGLHGAFNERQTRALNAVRANADRLLRLINDLLDVSKLESGVTTLTAEPVELADIVARAVAHTRVLAANAGVSVTNLISTARLPKVLADETKLHQVIENLLSNAVKFTPNGGNVAFTAAASNLPSNDPALLNLDLTAASNVTSNSIQSVVLSVTDTGTGIEEEQLTRIWDRFYQVDSSAKRRSGGTGLGLSIVRSLVDLHGGQAWAKSQGANQGSSFSFSLPVAPGAESSLPAREQTFFREQRGDSDTGRPTVLLVEDDADQRQIICDMLEMEGYRVVVASDGDEALYLAQTVKPAAIALDVVLPRRDGWEVLHRLKRGPDTRDIPVLIISVVDQQEFGKSLGADEYLVKPLEASSLRAVVRRLVGDERPHRARQQDD